MGRTDEWKISTFCADSTCVEVRREEGVVHLRTTGAPDTVLTMTTAEWEAFVKGVAAGEF